jgi:ATP-binding cassette, subfamily B, multidrug efflux pump
MLREFRTLLPYFKKYRCSYIVGLAFLIAIDAAQLLIPQYVRVAVDDLSLGKKGGIPALVISIIGVAVIIAAGRFLWRYFLHGASRRIEIELRDRLFNHFMVLPSGFYQKNKIGDLMARSTNDLNAIRMAAGMGLVTFVDGVFLSAAILIIMIVRNPRTSLITVLPLIPVTILIIVFGRMVGRRFKRVQELYSSLSDTVQETITGIRVVKSFVKEDVFAARFASVNDEYRDSSLGLAKIFGFFFPLISFLSGLTNLILLGVGGAAVIENRMSPGDITATLAYLEMLIWPMIGAGFTVNMIQRGATSLKRVNEILDEKPEADGSPGKIQETPKCRAPSNGNPALEFRSLSFSYPEAKEKALRNFCLALPAGTTLGILGRIGSGKSTLLRLLPRMMEPPRGTVFLAGRDVLDYDLSALRRTFGFVPQDTFLFSDTMKANILFGAPDLPPERFARITDISALDRDVKDFPAGWDTLVGEKGLTLSGGQKQRVAIARALAVDPEILVFDDALSAVDTETEERILKALLAERAGRTNIIVSNRISTLRHADRIAVLDSGSLVQYGTHRELLSQEGFYAEIARLQALARDTVPESPPSGEGKVR